MYDIEESLAWNSISQTAIGIVIKNAILVIVLPILRFVNV
jgi:hypothetical protein